MNAEDALTPEAELAALDATVHQALPLWGLPAASTLTLLNHSENTTYRVDPPDGAAPVALRVHRDGYHTRDEIASELAWMEALRRDADVHTPIPIKADDGDYIQTLSAGLPNPRFCTMFHWIEGEAPDESRLLEPFERLGEVTARCHKHSRSWLIPPGFERLTWDYETTLGQGTHWGRWQDGPHLDAEKMDVLNRTSDLIRRRLERFGKGPERFGLIHADFRLANLLIHEGDTRVIDFDDSGFGWYLYDLATALSFMEERPEVPALVYAWLKGYRKVQEVSAEEEAEIQTFIMLRRMLIIAWMGSHHETDLAEELGKPYIDASIPLAEDYLISHG